MSSQNIVDMLALIWAVNLALPVILGLAAWWWEYVARSDKDLQWGRWYMRLKWSKFDLNKYDDLVTYSAYWITVDFLIAGIILTVLGSFLIHAPVAGAVLLVISVSPMIVRGCVDICRTLRMNWNTGDSERLAALEAEINKLKGNQ